MMRHNVVLSILTAFVFGAAAMLYVTAQDRTVYGLATPITNILTHKKFVSADVKVWMGTKAEDFGHGSGVHVGGGRVLTARHVLFAAVTNGKKLYVETRDGEEHSVEVIWSSPLYDIAMLQVTGMDDAEVATMTCYHPQVGDEVSWVGNILDEDFLTGYGRVSSGNRTDDVAKWRKYFAITGAISPGMSGGGVYDTRGRLIGISVGYLGAGKIDNQPINSNFGVVVPGSALCLMMGR